MKKKVNIDFHIDFDDDFEMNNGDSFLSKKYVLEIENDKDIHDKFVNALKIDLSEDNFKKSHKNPENLIEMIDHYLKGFDILEDKNINFSGNWEFELNVESIKPLKENKRFFKR